MDIRINICSVCVSLCVCMCVCLTFLMNDPPAHLLHPLPSLPPLHTPSLFLLLSLPPTPYIGYCEAAAAAEGGTDPHERRGDVIILRDLQQIQSVSCLHATNKSGLIFPPAIWTFTHHR